MSSRLGLQLARRMTWLAAAIAVFAACTADPLQPSSNSAVGDPGPVVAGGAGGGPPDAGAGGAPAGLGGSAGAGSAGSAGPYVPGPCVPPAADPTLARFQRGAIGQWMGTATTPTGWNWSQASVEFAFYCDGHYHARCLSSEGFDPSCSALYYGSDEDSPEKVYDINDVRLDGKATGDIVVYFGATTTNDQLSAIDLDAAGAALSFDLIHLDQYGPVHYQLQRQP